MGDGSPDRQGSTFGAWAQRTVVPAEEVWDVPDDIDDRLAIALGIAGTGALVPLTEANIQAEGRPPWRACERRGSRPKPEPWPS